MNERRDALRRGYEKGRLLAALPWALWIAPAALASLALFGLTAPTVGALLVSPIAVVWARWRGGPVGRAVLPGIAAGSLAFVLAVAGCGACGPLGCASETSALALACALAGLVAGGVVGWRAAGLERGHARFVLFGAALAGAIGSFGCASIGVTAVVGMAIGLGVATAPVLVTRGLRA